MAKKPAQQASKTKRATAKSSSGSSSASPARKAARSAKPAKADSPKTVRSKTAKAGGAATGAAKRSGGMGGKAVNVRPKHARTGAAGASALLAAPPAVIAAGPIEQPLTRDEIEEFRHMLVRKRTEIVGDMSTLQNEALNKNRRDASGDLSSMPIHMADLGSDNFELEFTLGLIEGERTILKEIDEAMDRIALGTYGLCVATGKPIGKARLKAKPWAKYCYEYTLAQEQGHARKV